jgi:hypothetical protein
MQGIRALAVLLLLVAAGDDMELSIAGNVIEVRIPLATLASELPAEMAADLFDPDARSWIRVTPFSEYFDSQSSSSVIADFGPAIGSFRLRTTPYALDPPLPVPDPNATPDPAVETERRSRASS